MESKRLYVMAILLAGMMLAAGCASSKCDCPNFHGKAETQQEQSV